MKDFWEQCIALFTDEGVDRTLAQVYLILIALILVMTIVALVMRIIVIVRYQKGNHTKAQSGKNSFEIAEEALQRLNLTQVKVKKAGFFRATFFGNSYSLSKKTIFLRRGIAEKSTITAIAMAVQKVGIAQLCESGNKTARTRNRMQVLNILSPVLFVPSVIIGILVDIVIFNALGIFSIIGIAVGLFFILTGFIATLLTLPVEKKANTAALQMIKENNLLNEQEQAIAKKIYSAYIIAYVCEFIIAILRLIQLILEIVMNVQSSNNKK